MAPAAVKHRDFCQQQCRRAAQGEANQGSITRGRPKSCRTAAGFSGRRARVNCADFNAETTTFKVSGPDGTCPHTLITLAADIAIDVDGFFDEYPDGLKISVGVPEKSPAASQAPKHTKRKSTSGKASDRTTADSPSGRNREYMYHGSPGNSANFQMALSELMKPAPGFMRDKCKTFRLMDEHLAAKIMICDEAMYFLYECLHHPQTVANVRFDFALQDNCFEVLIVI
jgi:hypothetical protein